MRNFLRYRLRSLLVATTIAALGLCWFNVVESPRIALINKITDGNGRLNYRPWSIRYPFPGQRVNEVIINNNSIAKEDLIQDLETLLTFPSLERIGANDETQILKGGTSVTLPTMVLYREHLPFYLELMKSNTAGTTDTPSH